MVSTSLSVLLVALPAALAFDVLVLNDPAGVGVGDRVAMAVEAENDLHNCRWFSPDGVRYRAGDSNRQALDYSVAILGGECSMTVREARAEDEGPWEVHVEDIDGDEEMRLEY